MGYLRSRYTSWLWCVLEYVALFLIVLLHEFGHALACRQVGGKANEILLWPLGGVAYVDPPQRPGPVLWSLAAGPLVNLALLLPLGAIGGRYLLADCLGTPRPQGNAITWIVAVLSIDIALLVFNILPIYPLDGGQILRSLLWFVLGRGRSLQASTVIGFMGAGVFICFAVWKHSTWLLAVSAYILLSCWNGWKVGRLLHRVERMPRRPEFACPNCNAKPAAGPHWRCAQCQKPFDTFETGAVCPSCNTQFPGTMCVDCQHSSPMREWKMAGAAHVPTLPVGGAVIKEQPAGT